MAHPSAARGLTLFILITFLALIGAYTAVCTIYFLFFDGGDDVTTGEIGIIAFSCAFVFYFNAVAAAGSKFGNFESTLMHQ